MFLGNLPKIDIDIQISSTYSMYLYECCVTFSHYVVLFHTRVIPKLRLHDEVGRWSKNVHILSMFVP